MRWIQCELTMMTLISHVVCYSTYHTLLCVHFSPNCKILEARELIHNHFCIPRFWFGGHLVSIKCVNPWEACHWFEPIQFSPMNSPLPILKFQFWGSWKVAMVSQWNQQIEKPLTSSKCLRAGWKDSEILSGISPHNAVWQDQSSTLLQGPDLLHGRRLPTSQIPRYQLL